MTRNLTTTMPVLAAMFLCAIRAARRTGWLTMRSVMTPRWRSVCLSLAAWAVTAPAGSLARGDIVYSVENGVAENGEYISGAATPPNLEILFNQFTALPTFGNITAVQVAWGDSYFGNGRPAYVAVWEDPNQDGNPSDAVLISLTQVTTQNAGTGTFVQYDVPTAHVEGSFFAGVGFSDADEFTGVMIATPSVPLGRSWAVSSTLDNIHGASNLDTLTIDHLMIRAVGSAVPEPSGAVLASVGLLSIVARYLWTLYSRQ